MTLPDTPLIVYGTVQEVARRLIDHTDKIEYLFPGKGQVLFVNRKCDLPAKSPDTERPIPRADHQIARLKIVPDKSQPAHGAQIKLTQLNDPHHGQQVKIEISLVKPDWRVVASLWAECEQILLSPNKPAETKTGDPIPTSPLSKKRELLPVPSSDGSDPEYEEKIIDLSARYKTRTQAVRNWVKLTPYLQAGIRCCEKLATRAKMNPTTISGNMRQMKEKGYWDDYIEPPK